MVVDHPKGRYFGKQLAISGLDELLVPFLSHLGDRLRPRIGGSIVVDIVAGSDEKIGLDFQDGFQSWVPKVFVFTFVRFGKIGVVLYEVPFSVDAIVTVEFRVIHTRHDDKPNGICILPTGMSLEF